jgi:predicted ATP-grasp superfamily ATP-dependent carboligase
MTLEDISIDELLKHAQALIERTDKNIKKYLEEIAQYDSHSKDSQESPHSPTLV